MASKINFHFQLGNKPFDGAINLAKSIKSEPPPPLKSSDEKCLKKA